MVTDCSGGVGWLRKVPTCRVISKHRMQYCSNLDVLRVRNHHSARRYMAGGGVCDCEQRAARRRGRAGRGRGRLMLDTKWQPGFCAYTERTPSGHHGNDPSSDCQLGDAGSWPLRSRSWAAAASKCSMLCAGCARCKYFSCATARLELMRS